MQQCTSANCSVMYLFHFVWPPPPSLLPVPANPCLQARSIFPCSCRPQGTRSLQSTRAPVLGTHALLEGFLDCWSDYQQRELQTPLCLSLFSPSAVECPGSSSDVFFVQAESRVSCAVIWPSLPTDGHPACTWKCGQVCRVQVQKLQRRITTRVYFLLCPRAAWSAARGWCSPERDLGITLLPWPVMGSPVSTAEAGRSRRRSLSPSIH